jgi:hypothetical protein
MIALAKVSDEELIKKPRAQRYFIYEVLIFSALMRRPVNEILRPRSALSNHARTSKTENHPQINSAHKRYSSLLDKRAPKLNNVAELGIGLLTIARLRIIQIENRILLERVFWTHEDDEDMDC